MFPKTIGLLSAVFCLSLSLSATCALPSSAGVNVCSPINGSTVSSPLTVSASAKASSGKIRYIVLYLDTVKNQQINSDHFDINLATTPGTHRLVLQAKGSNGRLYSSAPINVTVPDSTPPPPPPPPPPSSGWTAPIGIPAPSFGIDQVAPASPTNWTATVAGFYYVNAGSAAATDTSNPNGYPTKPRKTIPINLPAGSVVELHGTYNFAHTGGSNINFQGTASSPVFIRGVDATTNRPTATKRWGLKGSYGIIENVYFNNQGQTDGGISLGWSNNADHIAIRHVEMRGDPNLKAGIMVGLMTTPTGTVSDLVLYDMYIHDQGNYATTVDQDAHGVTIGASANHVWLLDSLITYCSGGAMQINAGSIANQPLVNHIYVGRVEGHHTVQGGIGVKQSQDVILSQNKFHDDREATWSAAKGFVYQYAPQNVWILYNEVYNESYGVFGGSDGGLGNGKDIYVIGNVFHDIHNKGIYMPNYSPSNSWGSAAVMMAGGTNLHVENNTMVRTDSGILIPNTGSTANAQLSNNVFVARSQYSARDLWVEDSGVASRSSMKNSLFFASPNLDRIQWGTSTVYGVPEFLATGKGAGSMAADPALVNTSGNDFHLGSLSPAIDHGVSDSVYTTFQNLYGIDIRKDKEGKPRPAGLGWDMGAYEAQ